MFNGSIPPLFPPQRAAQQAFALTDNGYGIKGIRGVIDPFGWAAPKQIDKY